MSQEQKLLQLASRLDTSALAEIYDSYSPGLYRYAMRLLGDATLAEDCVADTFTRFLHSLQVQHGPRDHLRAYLYRIAHNWIIDRYRDPDRCSMLNEALRCSGDVPEEQAAKNICQTRVREAIRELTPDQQKVISLKYLEEWSNEDVARVLHKPVGAVKSLQHRALKRLQKSLLEEAYDEQST